MSSNWGNNLKISLFGESHGKGVGIVLDGLPPGLRLDLDKISFEMKRRAPGGSPLKTARSERDQPEIISGLFQEMTTGAPLCAIIPNNDVRSPDYQSPFDALRPGHADYTGAVRYSGFNDYRGGGAFSGRLTAPLVFCGAICRQYLEKDGIEIGAHIKNIGGIEDAFFDAAGISPEKLRELRASDFPLIDRSVESAMKNAVAGAAAAGDSTGGVVEAAVTGLAAGLGDPFFDSVESILSHLLFSVPAVKGVEFGLGFGAASVFGSQCNDEFYAEGEKIKTRTNRNGGILGGITTGMPVVFRVAVKPTPSIKRPQKTVGLSHKKEILLEIKGRHDPCIVPRAVPVVEAAAAIGIFELTRGARP